MTTLKKILIFFSLFFLLISPTLARAQEMVIIDSKDWKDVYSSMLLSSFNNENYLFVTSSNPQGVFNLIPPAVKEIKLIQSSDAFIPNLANLLKTQGYSVQEVNIEEAQFEFYDPNEFSKIYIVSSDYPTSAIIVAPHAIKDRAWVFIASQDNIDTISQLSSGKEVIVVGYFNRDLMNKLEALSDELIVSPSKFNLSIEMAERFLRDKPTTQVIISDGNYLEKELFSGSSPVLIVGPNFVPDQVLEFIKARGIKTSVVIGSHLTYVGERIRSLTDKQVSVFIKFGQAVPGSQIFALSLYPLPTVSLNLSVSFAKYSPKAKALYLGYSNLGEAGVFELTTFRVLDEEGNEIAAGGDEEVVFIGAGENLVRSYSLDLAPEYLTQKLTVEIFTIYGESPDNMDSYITETGEFGPPLRLDLEFEDIEDRSSLDIVSVSYLKGYNRLKIVVNNTGSVKAYFVVKVEDLIVRGIPTSLSSRVNSIGPGELKNVYIPVELDEIDLEENSEVNVIITYGETRGLFVNTKEKVLPLSVEESWLPGGLAFIAERNLTIIAVIAVAIIVAVVYLMLKKKGKKRRKR